MKKLLFIVLALSSGYMLSAQATFNPKIGYNYSYFSEDYENQDIEGKSGWQVGADIKFGDQIFFAPGLHYFESNNRVRSVGGINVTNGDISFDVKGLRIPAVVGVDLIEGRRAGLRAYTGPNLTVILDNDEDAFDSGDFLYKETTWGYNVGVGLDIGIITIDLNHEWGLTNVFEPESIKSKNNRFFLSLGLLF